MSDDVDLTRLSVAMQRSRLVLRNYREERRDAVRQYVGAHWSEDGSTRPTVPVNLISLYVSIVSRNLIANHPRVMLSTFNREARPTVTAMEKWANKAIVKMNLVSTLQRVVLDGLFSIGITKVALATPADSSSTGYRQSVAQPFAARVDLDDFIFDARARDLEEAGFMGHRFRAPLEMIRDSKLYSKARNDLMPSLETTINQQGDEKISTLGKGTYNVFTEGFEDMVELWEIYLPRQRLVITVADDEMGGFQVGDGKLSRALRVQKWVGPDEGPYHILGYGTVPGNPMPKAPVQDLIDLHLLVNNIYRKLGQQAQRQKEILPTRGGSSEDIETALKTNDGEAFRCDNADTMKALVFGGPSTLNLQFGDHCKSLFSWAAGNLDMMGGLSPQSKTLGQDRMLEQNASKAVSDLQDRTVSHAAAVVKALLWFWWYHPTNEMKVTHEMKGMPQLDVEQIIAPADRASIQFDNADVKVDPYSMQYSTPQSRLQMLTQTLAGLQPLMPLLQQQGRVLDVDFYLEKIAEYSNDPDLTELFASQPPPPPEQPGGGGGGQAEQVGMPQETTRNYVRRSLGNDTQANKDGALQNMMAHANSQNGEAQ